MLKDNLVPRDFLYFVEVTNRCKLIRHENGRFGFGIFHAQILMIRCIVVNLTCCPKLKSDYVVYNWMKTRSWIYLPLIRSSISGQEFYLICQVNSNLELIVCRFQELKSFAHFVESRFVLRSCHWIGWMHPWRCTGLSCSWSSANGHSCLTVAPLYESLWRLLPLWHFAIVHVCEVATVCVWVIVILWTCLCCEYWLDKVLG